MSDPYLALDGEPLAETAPLWRYIKLSTLLYLLKSKRSFLPKLGTLQQGDPFEGKFYSDSLHARLDLIGEEKEKLEQWLRREDGETKAWEKNRSKKPKTLERPSYLPEPWELRLRELMKRRLVWCWYQSECECMAQWRIYGEFGVAIRSDVASVKSVLQPKGDRGKTAMVYGRVHYLSPNQEPSPDLQERLAKHPYFIKHAAFAHEKEVRFVLEDDDPELPTGVQ